MRDLFESYLDNALANIDGDYVDIISGNVYRTVGGRPDCNKEMPVCCEVMYSRLRGNDEVLYVPPNGNGAYLKIRYYNRGVTGGGEL